MHAAASTVATAIGSPSRLRGNGSPCRTAAST